MLAEACVGREYANIVLCNTLGCLVVSLAATVSSLDVLANERPMFWRMAGTGYSKVCTEEFSF